MRQLSDPLPSFSRPKPADDRDAGLRFIYSYFALYGDALADSKLDPYPDGLLQRLSALAVNGVWLRVVLHDVAPGGTTFPEFGVGRQERLANLKAIVARAKKYGIDVYLYLNEPHAMPTAFFKTRPEMAGVREGDFTALCTSHPAVRQWISDALAYVFREVPGLGGVFTITASEGLTNCASHGHWRSCPHCKNRHYADIITEINAVMEEGVHRGNPQAKVIVWDWGWRSHGRGSIVHGDAPDIVARLPKSVWLMSVSEWALPLDRGGVRTSVGEYSLSAVGPGPRATLHWKAAKDAGLKTVAKVQLNNSWELATVPYLPVMDLVAEHCHHLASAGVDGMMLSWTCGGYPSPNLELATRFRASRRPAWPPCSMRVAAERYGAKGLAWREPAWTALSTALNNTPSISARSTIAPCNLVRPIRSIPKRRAMGRRWAGYPYDDLTQWRGPYPAETLATQFEKVAAGWRSGHRGVKAGRRKGPAGSTCQKPGGVAIRRGGLHAISNPSPTRLASSLPATRWPILPAASRPTSGIACGRNWAVPASRDRSGLAAFYAHS